MNVVLHQPPEDLDHETNVGKNHQEPRLISGVFIGITKVQPYIVKCLGGSDAKRSSTNTSTSERLYEGL